MPKSPKDIGPERVIKSSRGVAWVYLAGLAALLALAGGLTYLFAPEAVARLHGRLFAGPLEIHGLTLTLNRQSLELPPGGSVEIHPGQPFAVAGLNTNRWLNYDLNLHSPDFDVTRVLDGHFSTPLALLDGALDSRREMRLEVREGEEVKASFTILSRFSALDFAARGDAADDPDEKLSYYQMALKLDPDSEVLNEKYRRTLLESGHTGLAAEQYELELARHGPNEELLSKLLELYESLGENDKKAEALKTLADLAGDPVRRVARLNDLAGHFSRQGQVDEAASVFELLIAEAPDTDRRLIALQRLIALYRENRRPDQEAAALKRLLDLVPPEQSAGIWAEIAASYERTGDDQGRLAAWRGLAESLPAGDNKVNAYKMLARLAAQSGRRDQAAAAYREALKLRPKDLNAQLNLARLSAALGDRPAYRAELAKAVDLAPDNLELRRELAGALREDGQDAKAKAQYEEILVRAPGDRAARLTLISLLEKTKDHKGLIGQYTQMLKEEPGNKVAAYNLGVAYFDQKQWDRAIESFQAVLKADPEDLEARSFLLVAYQRKGQRKEMLAEAMELYRRDPAQTVYRTLMLNTYENAGDWANFTKTAEECARLAPGDPEAWFHLAKGQARLNRKKDQAESLWKFAETTPDKKIQAWLSAAAAFSSLGQNDQARQAYEKVVELDPDNTRAAEALIKLQLRSLEKKS